MSNAMQKAPAGKATLATFQDLLYARREALAQVLPKQLPVQKMIRLALVAMARTPKLLECTPTSVIRSIMEAAQLGIDPTGALGYGYLIPRHNGRTKQLEATFLIGWRGLIDLARRSGEVLSVEAHVVHEGDRFDFAWGFVPRLEHVPAMKADAAVVSAYAFAKLRSGEYVVEVMSRDQIEAVRRRARAESGPWDTDWSEMARKTVVRRLAKYLPRSVELDQVLARDDAAEAGDETTLDLLGGGEDAPGAEATAVSEHDARAETLALIHAAPDKAALETLARRAKQLGLSEEYAARRTEFEQPAEGAQ